MDSICCFFVMLYIHKYTHTYMYIHINVHVTKKKSINLRRMGRGIWESLEGKRKGKML